MPRLSRQLPRPSEDSDRQRVTVYTSPSSQTAGSDYRAAIAAELIESDCVLLLYTDESQQWDWSLYECGFFHGHHRGDFVVGAVNNEPYLGRRLFIIHRTDVERPKPLENWESITVDTSVVVPVDLFRLTPLQSFLERLFFERSFNSEPPILRQSGEAKVDQLVRLGDPIINALRGHSHRPKKFAPLFAVEILGNAIWPDDGELPAGTMISSDDRRAFDALGVDPLGSRVPWTDVESQTRLRLENAWSFWNSSFGIYCGTLCRNAESIPLYHCFARKGPIGYLAARLRRVLRTREGTWIIKSCSRMWSCDRAAAEG